MVRYSFQQTMRLRLAPILMVRCLCALVVAFFSAANVLFLSSIFGVPKFQPEVSYTVFLGEIVVSFALGVVAFLTHSTGSVGFGGRINHLS
jgi:hypothetical protein